MPVSTATNEPAYSFLEVVSHLQVAPETLRQWSQRFAPFFSEEASADVPRYGMADIASLITVQKLIEQGLSDEQVRERLRPKRIQFEPNPQPLALSQPQSSELANGSVDGNNGFSHAVGDLLSTIANSQQTVLNGQNTVREMVGVVVQDNFNLKEENRKLRERMLELERDLAEYQRKEETRRERSENRMRALEGTVSALQQQVAQMTQLLQAQRNSAMRRRGWFG